MYFEYAAALRQGLRKVKHLPKKELLLNHSKETLGTVLALRPGMIITVC
jgi:hypothetical protein